MAQVLTPIETHHDRGRIFRVKRDDLFGFAGWSGGKVRTCNAIATAPSATLFDGGTLEGLVTASSRHSPQAGIVAAVAAHHGIGARLHVPWALERTDVLAYCAGLGAEIVEHRPGYNNVIVARARADVAGRWGWRHVPFGMECAEAVAQTRAQVANLPGGRRLVLAAGSGMSLAGILWGLADHHVRFDEVVAVVVGANPRRRLDEWAPSWWPEAVRLVPSPLGYGQPAPRTMTDSGLVLDPYYEAKVLPRLDDGDVFWVVGIRKDVSCEPKLTTSSTCAGGADG